MSKKVNIFFFFTLFYSLLAPFLGVNTKLCGRCKYYIPSINTVGHTRIELGKCKLFIIQQNQVKYNHHVIGRRTESDSTTEYSYCSDARINDTMCGEGAVYFKRYDKMDPLFLLASQMYEEQKRITLKIQEEQKEIVRLQKKHLNKDA